MGREVERDLIVVVGWYQGALRMHMAAAAVQATAKPKPQAVDLGALKQELERFYARHSPEKLGNVPQVPFFEPPCWQPRCQSMLALVNSHTNATRIGWHLWEIDLRFSSGLPPGWLP